MAAAFALAAVFALAACGVRPIKPSQGHLMQPEAAPEQSASIPPPVRNIVMPPPPASGPRGERYSVVVNRVRVQDLLYALARDAKVNIDIHPGIEGLVTLNAIDQTLPQLLGRIARQVDMRYELDGANIVVMPDSPFLRNYHVDYINLGRTTTTAVGISTQVQAGGASGTPGGTSGGGGNSASGSNNSTTLVTSTINNRFWDTLIQNVKDLLRETDRVVPLDQQGGRANARTAASANAAAANEGTEVEPRVLYREAASVIANPETGVLSVRATGRQHEKVQEFLDHVQGSARRQVLIESTIVEVQLSDQYQGGVDWSRIVSSGNGFNWSQSLLGSTLGQAPFASVTYNPSAATQGGLTGTLRLLDQFGTTRVLSSPKLAALNNQTAVLKVVDNIVYFSIESSTTTTANVAAQTSITTTPHSVSVGLVMSVTPQISETGEVALVVRPTISRIIDFKNDPTPLLVDKNLSAPLTNPVPEIQVREMESVLHVNSGQVVVLGGLMQDTVQTSRNGVPGLAQIPGVGDAFSVRNDTSKKVELVVFLRPVFLREASLQADLRPYRKMLPTSDFFREEIQPPAPLRQPDALRERP